VAYLLSDLSDLAFETVAREHGGGVRALSRMYVTAPPRQGLMLNFSGYPKQIIAPAVSRLASAAAELRPCPTMDEKRGKRGDHQ
jgi:GntR family transcriptional regulator / MocR family aminotransferase